MWSGKKLVAARMSVAASYSAEINEVGSFAVTVHVDPDAVSPARIAAQVRSGKLSKEEAKEQFNIKSEFDFTKLGTNAERMLRLVNMRMGSRDNFVSYGKRGRE